MSVSPQLPETEFERPSAAVARQQQREQIRDGSLVVVLAATLEAMTHQWHSGKPRPAEEWLADYPELAADPESAVRVVYEEFCLREERGERVEPNELYSRFPQWRDPLAVVLDCHRLLRNVPEPDQVPAAGQSLGELRLLEELGRGALGKVFLATQPSLSDRPLVVKLTERRGNEHLSLARLQHTNIVPLYLVQDFPDENLRALCMPYLGGATWSAVLQAFQGSPLSDRSGRQIVDCLAEVSHQTSVAATTSGPAIGFLTRSTYVDAVCWIGACLADALYYAHQRGLVHLDVKPSNVLLAADGQPMLLDFHLACEIERLQDKTFIRLGGTPGYMSPEQNAATEAIRHGDPIPRPLDDKSDVYSLGVLLYESLAGCPPEADAATSRRALRKANPQVSHGLEDIVHKCLARTPTARYPDAGQLAADLRRHMASLPLGGVANRSLAERWRKWRRRRPLAMPLATFGIAAALVVGIAGGILYRDRVRNAESLLHESQRELGIKDFEHSVHHAQAALGDLRWFPWQADLKDRINAQLTISKRGRAAAALHDFVEQLRFLDDRHVSEAKLNEYADKCRQFWQVREALFTTAGGDAAARDEAPLNEQLRHDLLDFAIFAARIDVRLAAPESASEARGRAAKMFQDAKEVCGPSPILELEERDVLADPSRSDDQIATDKLPSARNAWEHYTLGRWLMRHRLLDEAERHFAAAIDLRPDDFWAQFQAARCNFDLGRTEQALTAATVCIALAPRRAECFYNRALCFEALHRDQEALADFSRALELDHDLAPAALARGALFGRIGRYAEAQSDLESALARGSRPSEVYYQLARLHLAQHDIRRARESLRQSLADDSKNVAAIALERELSASAH
jgi:eukaryotic-like serine/threonine-protein kinase